MTAPTIPIDNIITTTRALHDARLADAAASEVLAIKLAAFKAEHADLITAAETAKAAVQHHDKLLRALVVAHYEATKKASPDGKVGDKQPLPGVGVKIGTEYEYDPKLALEWATAKGMCITKPQLDQGAFKDICKSESNRPEFVKVVEVPGPNIASDLTKALADVAALPTVEAPAEAGAVA